MPSEDFHFMSSATVGNMRSLAEQVAKLKTDLSAAERALGLASKNRDLVELAGDDPGEKIRQAKAAVDLAKSQLFAARNELMRAFIAARNEFEASRSANWAKTYTEVVQPRAEKIAGAINVLERAVEEVAGLLQPDSESVLRLDAVNAEANSWNSFVATLDGPGNARVNVSAGLNSLRASFSSAVKIPRIESILKLFRDAVNPPPKPAPPVTEESLRAARVRAEELASVEAARVATENFLRKIEEDKNLLEAKPKP